VLNGSSDVSGLAGTSSDLGTLLWTAKIRLRFFRDYRLATLSRGIRSTAAAWSPWGNWEPAGDPPPGPQNDSLHVASDRRSLTRDDDDVKPLPRKQADNGARPRWHPIPAWSWTLGAVLAVALTALVVTTWLLSIAGHADPGTDQANARLDAVRTGLAAGAGAGAAVGLMLAFRRQHHAEISTVLTDYDATERRITELYTKAVEQLGNDKAPVRLGGLYALERLAQDNPEHRQTIVNVICAYLRMPFPTEAPSTPTDDTWQQEKQVRFTAQRILSNHLRRPDRLRSPIWLQPSEIVDTRSDKADQYWEGIRLDLTGATLIGFSLAQAIVGEALFNGVTFSGYSNFDGVTFNGYTWFDGATFEGTAKFSKATFNGDESGFNSAIFSGNTWFDEATFNGYIGFVNATFGNYTTFSKTNFKKEAGFSSTRYSGSAKFDEGIFVGFAGFSKAIFSGEVSFNGTTFNNEARFDGAIFNGNAEFVRTTFNGVAQFGRIIIVGLTELDGATFKSETKFGEANFNDTAKFNEAIFVLGPDAIDFTGAVAHSSAHSVWPAGWQLHDEGPGNFSILRSGKGP
jgi:uncharacterized protein YjbI with pentapeptide repeats